MKNNEADDWIDKGDKAYNAQNYEEAVKCYAEAAKLEPENFVAFQSWGSALFQLAVDQPNES
jgi:cytochrome c-type biogenesis protein CcmH/NrfG